VKITIDTLSTVNDDELYNISRRLRSKISRLGRDRSLSSRDKEHLMRVQTDLCYVQREMSIRKARHEAHKAFLANNL